MKKPTLDQYVAAILTLLMTAISCEAKAFFVAGVFALITLALLFHNTLFSDN